MNYGKKKKMKAGGMAMKDVPMDKKKSLGKLPTEVRNKMGFKKAGGKVKKMAQGGSIKGKDGTTRKLTKKGDNFDEYIIRDKKGNVLKEIRPNKLFSKGKMRQLLGREDKVSQADIIAKGSKKKMKEGGGVKKAVTEGMKKAAKTGAGLGAAIAKVKKKQAKDKSPKGFRGDPNKDGTFKKGGLTKKESQSKSKRLEDFAATAFQPKTPKERKAAAIDKVKRENKSQSNQERKKESSRKLKEIQSKLKPGMPMFKKGGMAKKKMMGGGMAMKYKHGGKVGKKCPRDGIAMKGKTKA